MKISILQLFSFIVFLFFSTSLLSQHFPLIKKQQEEIALPAPPNISGNEINSKSSSRELDSNVSNRCLNEIYNVGRTYYDFQTNGSISNRVYASGQSHDFCAVWTLSTGDDPFNFGTGINCVSEDDCEIVDEAIDSTENTFSPNLIRLSNSNSSQETNLIVCHKPIDDGFQIQLLRNSVGSQEWEFGTIPTNTPHGVLWPRAVGTGEGNRFIHVVAATTPKELDGEKYLGVNFHLLYYRSSDGGQTWDIVDKVIPGLDSTAMANLFRAESYSLAGFENTIALTVHTAFNDILVFKSTDNGDTWEKSLAYDFPFDKYDLDDGYALDEIPNYEGLIQSPNDSTVLASDGSGTTVIDKDGEIHTFFGLMFYQDTELADSTFMYFPCTDGLAYWKESFGEDSIQIIAGVEELQNNDQLDLDCEGFDFGLYGTMGLTSMPTATVTFFNRVIVGYTSVMEGGKEQFVNFNLGDDGMHFRKLYFQIFDKRYSEPVWHFRFNDFVSDPFVQDFSEPTYLAMPKRHDFSMPIFYQWSTAPDNAFDWNGRTDPENNEMIWNDIPIPHIDPIQTNEVESEINLNIHPNPSSDLLNLSFEMPLSGKVNSALFDLNGRKIKSVIENENYLGLVQESINVKALAAGVYILELNINGTSLKKKVVVQ